MLLLMSAAIGCGVYSFDPSGKSEIQSLAIERFDNKTAEFGLSDRLTDLIIDAFIADGNVQVVPPDRANATLTGTLTGYRREPYEFDENDQVQSYRVVLNFEIAMVKPDGQEEKWRQQITEEGIYDADTETEEDGQRRASERLVETIINKTTKDW